ncbi:ATP-binding protein [Nonomuraea sp. NPDC049714]|uniref:ATP-binding protein n=1 Tax=Nonomuraea sp. NPDC049714 TaxID=3364357 RepID=UPI0037B684CF
MVRGPLARVMPAVRLNWCYLRECLLCELVRVLTRPRGERPIPLVGRRAEREPLDRLVEDIRAGESRELVLHGLAGTGKTALLAYTAGRASGAASSGCPASSQAWGWPSRACTSCARR